MIKPDTIYKLTVEAYGQTEVVHFISFDGKHKHHRRKDVPDQARQDGENLLRLLDDMYERSIK